MSLNGIFIGTITEVYPPSHQLNDSNDYQYMYEVIVATDKYAYLPVKAIRMDPVGGGLFNYDDIIFTLGQQVFIGFPFSDTGRGVIIGGRRQVPEPQREEGKIRLERKFNEIVQSISHSGIYQLRHSSVPFPYGPMIELTKDRIFLTDNGARLIKSDPLAQSIEIDAINKTIKIKSGTWTLDATSGVTINVEAGNVEVNSISASINAKNSVNVKTSVGAINVESGVACNIKAAGPTKVEGKVVMINSKGNPLDGVITTTTQPTCYITGIPFRGSTTVLAGS